MAAKHLATRPLAIFISGTYGMGPKSLGRTGTSWPGDLSRKLTLSALYRAEHAREFGMQGYPNHRTVKAWQKDGDDSQYFPQSRVSANHNKAVS